ncbi:MAG TPA: imidazole glycerol phosphate synthase subunit HisH [Chloroflexota bacterium]|jgi:glutamine amidotransferase
MVVVVDYGAGNLRSVEKALLSLGHAMQVTNDPDVVRRAEALILPGVGAAADTMRALNSLGLSDAVCEYVAGGRPFLGVCMGLQALLTGSEEGGWQPCLDLVAGSVRRFFDDWPAPPNLKVPHMGWNTVHQTLAHPILDGIPDDAYFYFVHSYYVAPDDPGVVTATTEYGLTFPCVLVQENLIGTQFHPEKSGDLGLRLYDNFVRLSARRLHPAAGLR